MDENESKSPPAQVDQSKLRLLKHSIEYNNVQYVKDNLASVVGSPDNVVDQNDFDDVIRTIAVYGKTNMMRWVIQMGYQLNQSNFDAFAVNGHLEMCKWMAESRQLVKWNKWTSMTAVRHKLVEWGVVAQEDDEYPQYEELRSVLRWLVNFNPEETPEFEALLGAIDRADSKYVAENMEEVVGPPNKVYSKDMLDTVLMQVAGNDDATKIMRWVVLMGYNVTPRVFKSAASSGNINMCQVMHSLGVKWDKYETIKYVKEHLEYLPDEDEQDYRDIPKLTAMMDWLNDPDGAPPLSDSRPSMNGVMHKLNYLSLRSTPREDRVWKADASRLTKPSQRYTEAIKAERARKDLERNKTRDPNFDEEFPQFAPGEFNDWSKHRDVYGSTRLVSRQNKIVNDPEYKRESDSYSD
jgi:hypothetical protein